MLKAPNEPQQLPKTAMQDIRMYQVDSFCYKMLYKFIVKGNLKTHVDSIWTLVEDLIPVKSI